MVVVMLKRFVWSLVLLWIVTPLGALLAHDPKPDGPRMEVIDQPLLVHLMHPGEESLPGDPNAAFFLDGTYHLHYILRHPWQGRQSFSFVHVTSPDLLHWTWQTTKLQPSFTGHGMFSGTGFLTKDNQPAVIYHGESSGRNQIAIAKDRQLSAWQKPFPVDVRDKNGEPANINHWDPDCFRIGDTYYAISGGPNPPLFKSDDLKTWTLVGDFMAHELPDVAIGEDVSCPNFFPLGDKWMLLCISHPLGCRYYIGDWDAERQQFVPEVHRRMNWKRDEQVVWGLFQRTDFFAPESVLTPDGRRVMWAWLTTAGPKGELLNKTVQSLPRELSLRDDGTLKIAPVRELESLRGEPAILENIVLEHPLTGHGGHAPPNQRPLLQAIGTLPSDACELRVTVERPEANRKLFGLVLFADEHGNGLPILFRPETGTIRLGSTEAPFVVSDLPEGEDIELRIFVDRYLVEVFVNNRQALVAAFPGYGNRRAVNAFTVGAPTTIQRLETWPLQPTNAGYLQAKEDHVWQPQTE
jgi:beta-fructofuranosidase